ncbi:hypothetical protein PGT21_022269 [Puccinia graminis f. sp. tritici]|uniref:Uncharacterized protein n=1 Tax=Puccinia graminis f. sp. tritici TaxID=56615 RepID=A0A5B0PIL8_PUCGR|nr:hypothetical protein PGT21_022269 [Puccinia graminis f. sp. tritici]
MAEAPFFVVAGQKSAKKQPCPKPLSDLSPSTGQPIGTYQLEVNPQGQAYRAKVESPAL